MRTVAFLLKREQPDAVDLCHRLCHGLVAALRTEADPAWEPLVLRNRATAGSLAPSGALFADGVRYVEEADLPGDLGLLVVLGGDGTLLYGSGLLRDPRTPVLGINLGHLGFLTACSPPDAEATLALAQRGELPIEDRQRLRCRLLRQGRVLAERAAVNDVVLSQAEKSRLMELCAFINGELITSYLADGLILATPTGSTAYNLAAGGPILAPHIDGVVLTPICPHTLTARPLVAPLDARITVRGMRSADSMLLTVDGQWQHHLEPGDEVEITRAEHPLRLLRAPGRTFYELLKTKLHWGLGREDAARSPQGEPR